MHAPSQPAPLLAVDGVTLQYKTAKKLVTATYRVDFQVFASDRYVLLGPSGCGKSTLLKAIGGYIAPTEGRITLKDGEVTKPGPDRVMVFQEFDQLLPWKCKHIGLPDPQQIKGGIGQVGPDELCALDDTRESQARRVTANERDPNSFLIRVGGPLNAGAGRDQIGVIELNDRRREIQLFGARRLDAHDRDVAGASLQALHHLRRCRMLDDLRLNSKPCGNGPRDLDAQKAGSTAAQLAALRVLRVLREKESQA